jgi:calcineurin-like phosphoesterase family protein
MANVFIISDTHFGHAGILNFKRGDGSPLRVFSSVEAMDEIMVEQWNSVVRPQDKVYHLGDVAMAKHSIATVGKCNGHKRLVRGNHDTHPIKEYLKYFEEIYATRVLDHMLFSHIPVHPESIGKHHANVHGHVHVPPRDYGPKYYNVCVEVIGYMPVSLEDLKARIIQKMDESAQ